MDCIIETVFDFSARPSFVDVFVDTASVVVSQAKLPRMGCWIGVRDGPAATPLAGWTGEAGHWRSREDAHIALPGLRALDIDALKIRSIGIENRSAKKVDGQCVCRVMIVDSVQFCAGLPCRLTVSLRSSSCEGQLDAIGNLHRKVIERLGTEAACYTGWTLIEPAEYLATGAFHMGLGGLAPWHLELPQKLYDSEGLDRQRYVRGLQWGNYLGPELNRRLDPDGSIADKFESWFQASDPPIVRPMVIRCASGGAFYAFSQNPATWTHAYEESEPGFANNWELALWFHRQLRAKGVLL